MEKHEMQEKNETITLNNIEYVRADQVKKQEIINFTGEETVASIMIGKPVIVRTRNEGINAGIVELADDTGVVLKNVRRIYFHRPKDKSLSWYEGVAESGLSEDSKVSGTVKRKVIIEDYSMTECKKEAYKSIMEKTPNAQN